MSNLQAIADRVDIEALRGEFTDAGMMRDYDRFASLFTKDGAWLILHANVEFVGREESAPGSSSYTIFGTTPCKTRTRARSG